MQETVLITGGSGLIGTRLSQLLVQKGYAVRHMSRKRNIEGNIPSYKWDLKTMEWDRGCIVSVSYIIHLAGAGVADGRWTTKRRKEIVNSRVKSSQLVCEMVNEAKGSIKGVVSTSAIGYYGIDRELDIVHEDAAPGEDFLAQVSVKWEEAISECSNTVNVSVIRTGIVLSNKGGALPKMALPVKLGVGSPLGTGEQPMPWIHIDDLCRMYIHAMEKGINGPYNGVAPEPVSNKVFTQELASVLNRRILLPNVPAFMLKLLFGEMAQVLLTGVNASSDKIAATGYEWNFKTLDLALEDIYTISSD